MTHLSPESGRRRRCECGYLDFYEPRGAFLASKSLQPYPRAQKKLRWSSIVQIWWVWNRVNIQLGDFRDSEPWNQSILSLGTEVFETMYFAEWWPRHHGMLAPAHRMMLGNLHFFWSKGTFKKTRWSPRTRMPTRMLTNIDNTYLSHFQQTHLWDTLTSHTVVTLL